MGPLIDTSLSDALCVSIKNRWDLAENSNKHLSFSFKVNHNKSSDTSRQKMDQKRILDIESGLVKFIKPQNPPTVIVHNITNFSYVVNEPNKFDKLFSIIGGCSTYRRRTKTI